MNRHFSPIAAFLVVITLLSAAPVWAEPAHWTDPCPGCEDPDVIVVGAGTL